MALEAVPRNLYKYYRAGSLEEFTEADLGSENEVAVIDTAIKFRIENLGYKFLGYAFAKPKYLDKLSEANLGILVIIKDGKTKQCVNVFEDALTSIEPLDFITREQIEEAL